MSHPEDEIATLARRARRVLALHGTSSDEYSVLDDDYVLTVWTGSNLKVSNDSRGNELEIRFFRKRDWGSEAMPDILNVYLESYGEVKHADASLAEAANEILGRVVVLDELGDA